MSILLLSQNDKHILYDAPTDAIVWEIHVRDFSISAMSGVSPEHRGKYLAFTESGTTLDGKGKISTCVDYLKKFGVTHVQILPMYVYRLYGPALAVGRENPPFGPLCRVSHPVYDL